MKAKILLKIATGCLVFFAFGHSMGHATRHEVSDPKAKAVLQQMMENKFDMFGQMRSYDENYTGMSLNLIFTLLALATVLWILSTQTEKQAKLVKMILVPITICIVGFSITGFLYFFPLPAITCLLAAVLTTISIFRLSGNAVES